MQRQVILVFFEALRRDHLHCYGYPRETSPVIDGIVTGKQGIMWSACQSMAGDTVGTFRHLSNYVKTLSDNKVPTLLYSANLTPISVFPASVSCYHEVRAWEAGYLRPATDPPAARSLIEAFIGAARRHQSFFGVLHFQETHCPYQSWGHAERFIGDETYRRDLDRWPGLSMKALVDLDKTESLQVYDGPDPDAGVASVLWTRGASRKRGKRVATLPAYYVAQYDGAIWFTDSCLPPLLDAFPGAEIWVTGDHGEGFYDTGSQFACHGYGLFPELRNVPLVVRTPRDLALYARVMGGAVTHDGLYNEILRSFGVHTHRLGLPWPDATDEVKKRLEGLGYVGR